MIPSNILGVLTPPEAKDIPDEEACLTCQVLGAFTAVAAGAYFSSGLPFKGDLDYKKSPKWWRLGVRSCGVPLLALGVYRGGQGWLWDKDIKYKDTWL